MNRNKGQAPLFTSPHDCARCGMQVMEYLGTIFKGAPAVVGWPGGERHRCYPDPLTHSSVGIINECLCGVVVSILPDGSKTEWETGKAHRCPVERKTPDRPTPTPSRPPTPPAREVQRQAQQVQRPETPSTPGPDRLPRGVIIL